MSTVTPAHLHHLALTVTDVDSSVRWYEGVFGQLLASHSREVAGDTVAA